MRKLDIFSSKHIILVVVNFILSLPEMVNLGRRLSAIWNFPQLIFEYFICGQQTATGYYVKDQL
jgi:hypothetical protein